MAVECTVPELGEDIDVATVVEVLVGVGDDVALDQSVLSLETDKAEFEMPSNAAGKVSEVLVAAGDDVRVGQAVLRLDGAGAEAGESAKSAKSPEGGAVQSAPRPVVPPKPSEQAPPPERPADEVSSAPAKPAAQPDSASEPEPADSEPDSGSEPGSAAPGPARSSDTSVAAAPAVRRLARELGVDLASVPGSGAGGRVTADDVKAWVRGLLESSKGAAVSGGEAPAAPLPDFSKYGPVEVRPMSKVRRKTAEQMARAWNRIPHVTHFDAADVTELERLRGQYAKRVEAAGGKLTMTAVILKILASALRKFPKFNASIDVDSASIVYKNYVHLGVAVDTEKGLLVPVIRDVEDKNIVQISLELRELSEKARSRNIRPDQLQGATFTLTNLGGVGGRAFAPLINPPEVAILGVSRARTEAVFTNGAFEPRLMMPLSVSYDHRVIDGADAARFLRWVCEALEEPFVVDLEGA
jgi:pyruvate dehydrogenase E2 component (dihydrolipoamide acetyltransferase)